MPTKKKSSIKAVKDPKSVKGSSQSPSINLKYAAAAVVLPYLVGLTLTSTTSTTSDDIKGWITGRRLFQESCADRIFRLHNLNALSTLRVNQNGQADACGSITDFSTKLYSALGNLDSNSVCPDDDKYAIESFLTQFIAEQQTDCHSQEPERTREEGFMGFCDMGPERTPILLDHEQLQSITTESGAAYLPCHFHTYSGIRLTSWQVLSSAVTVCDNNATTTCAENDNSGTVAQLFAVPAGRMYHFAPSHVGQIIPLPHIDGGDPTLPVYLKVLSLSPRVFDLVNFFTPNDAVKLVEHALGEDRDSHRIKRSSTGVAGYTLNRRRTSESGFDVTSPTAVKLKKRSFQVLGFDEYHESFSDGLQILRYNLTTAYIPHLDWLDVHGQTELDYNSGKTGGNRFATILLYMSDLDDNAGGETVFTEAWPAGQDEQDRVGIDEAIAELRESEQGKVLTQDSWEENMVAKCRTRLAVKPKIGHSVLFYSQLPNGQLDQSSRHGGCPVLSGQKYAANLWVWSTPREGYAGFPKNPDYKKDDKSSNSGDNKADDFVEGQVTASFINSGSRYEEVDLFYGDNHFWASLSKFDAPRLVRTFKGHVWKIKSKDGQVLHTWTITDNKVSDQEFQFE